MEQLELWFGLVGAWLIFAGSIYQAALELREQDLNRDELMAAGHSAQVASPRVSPWWWLLPPVHYVLRRRQSHRFRDALLRALTADQVQSLVTFNEKSSGWLYVALGGFLIGARETWDLFDHNEWPMAAYWPAIVVVAALCGLNVVVRMARSKDMRSTKASQTPS